VLLLNEKREVIGNTTLSRIAMCPGVDRQTSAQPYYVSLWQFTFADAKSSDRYAVEVFDKTIWKSRSELESSSFVFSVGNLGKTACENVGVSC
jgi:hypothetical protein